MTDGYPEPDTQDVDRVDQTLLGIQRRIDVLRALFDTGLDSGDLQYHCEVLEELRELRRDLGDVEQNLMDRIGDLMPRKTVVVDGLGGVHRYPRKSYVRWDKDALLRTVLDSRLVNTDTGEVFEESPLDRVLAVWNLQNPRVTALRARGIDPDDFCETEAKPGYTIRIEAA